MVLKFILKGDQKWKVIFKIPYIKKEKYDKFRGWKVLKIVSQSNKIGIKVISYQ